MTDSNEWSIFTVHSQLETTQPNINVELQGGSSYGVGHSIPHNYVRENSTKEITKYRIAAIYHYTENVLRRTTETPQQAQVKVIYKTKEVDAPLVVVAGEGFTLFWQKLAPTDQLDWKDIQYVTTAIDKLLQKHKVLFKDEMRTMKDIQVRLCVKSDALVKFCRAKSAPYAL